MAPGVRAAHRLSGRRARQRVRSGRRHRPRRTSSSRPSAVELAPLVVTAPVDELLDPLATSTEQKISAADLRDLPVSSLEEAIALSAGAVGTSYRGGRLGEESFILDGLGVKNQLDAASGGLGLRLPPDLLGEASLVTNGVLRPLWPGAVGPGERRHPRSRRLVGGARCRRDRPAVRRRTGSRTGSRWRCGRAGPSPAASGVVAAIDVAGRLDDDPVNAPPPTDPRDPRSSQPDLLPAQQRRAVEWRGQGGRADRPAGACSAAVRRALRGPAPAVRSRLQVRARLRPGPAAARRSGERPPPASHRAVVAASRSSLICAAGRFVREFLRGQLDGTVDYAVGAITGSRFHIVGEGPGARVGPVARGRSPDSACRA